MTTDIYGREIGAAIVSSFRTGRGPSGKLRNFRAMGYDKLWPVTADIIYEANDADALFDLAEIWEFRGESEKAAELATLGDKVRSQE